MGLAGAEELKSERYAFLESMSLLILVLIEALTPLLLLLDFPALEETVSALPPLNLVAFILLDETEANSLLPTSADVAILGFFSLGSASSDEEAAIVHEEDPEGGDG